MCYLRINVFEWSFGIDLKSQTVNNFPDRIDLFDGGFSTIYLLDQLAIGFVFEKPVEVWELDKLSYRLSDVLLDVSDFFEELFSERKGFLRLVLGEIWDHRMNFWLVHLLVEWELRFLLDV